MCGWLLREGSGSRGCVCAGGGRGRGEGAVREECYSCRNLQCVYVCVYVCVWGGSEVT